MDVHELLELAADSAARASWREIGAQCVADARSYYLQRMRRTWGITAVREFARHRLRRVCYIGATGRRPRAAQAAAQPAGGEWAHRSASEFHAYSVRARGAFAGQSARRGAPSRGRR